MPYELLWYRTGLDPASSTEVIMTSLADSKMSIDFVLFTSDPETVSQMYVLYTRRLETWC